MQTFSKKNWPAYILPILCVLRFLIEIPNLISVTNPVVYLAEQFAVYAGLAIASFALGYVFLIIYRTKNTAYNAVLGIVYSALVSYVIPILFVGGSRCDLARSAQADAGGDFSCYCWYWCQW